MEEMRSRAERIRDGKRSCGRMLERGGREWEAEDGGGNPDFRDLPARIAVACGIFLLLFLAGRIPGVLEEKSVQVWVQENSAYERLVQTTAKAAKEWMPGDREKAGER